jgi:hypothetical protein
MYMQNLKQIIHLFHFIKMEHDPIYPKAVMTFSFTKCVPSILLYYYK